MAPKPKSAAQQKTKSAASAEPSALSAKASKGTKKGKAREGAGDPAPPRSAPHTASSAAIPTTSEGVREMWPHVTLSEGTMNEHAPVFTPDAKYFFAIHGPSVMVYSSATGHIVSTLSAKTSSPSSSTANQNPGHTKPVTGVNIHPSNPLQLITASLDGSIKIWDYIDAVLLATISVHRPITSMCIDTSAPDSVFVSTLGKPDKSAPGKEKRSSVFRVPLRGSETPVRVCQTQPVIALGASPSGKWLVVATFTKIYVCALTSTAVANPHKYSAPHAIACFAFHPSEDYFATGSVEGEIDLWYCLTSTGQLPARTQTTMLHWHSHRVSALAFTPNGAYLLSGGEESVLVIWQMSANTKDFVPRIGAPIVSIAVTPAAGTDSMNEGYLLALADGSLVVVDAASHKIRQEVPRLKLAPKHLRPPTEQPIPLAVHEASGTIILPSSHPSAIQFYDPVASRLVSELEITPSNRISRAQDIQSEPVRVSHAVTCPSGRWLATVDGRADSIGAIYLKIWEWNGRSWTLNTRVDRPHGSGKVQSLAFKPTGTSVDSWQLVTVGEDSNVKTWRAKSVGGGPKTKAELFWLNRSTFGWRAMQPRLVTWARDGSLFAVAFDRTVVLFDPDSNTVLQTLSCPEVAKISLLAFLGASGQHLVVSSASDLAVWDLVTAKVKWHHHNAVNALENIISHPSKDSFIVLERRQRSTQIDLVEYGSASAQPVRRHTTSQNIRSSTFFSLSASLGDFTLLNITRDWAIILLGDGAARFEDAHAKRSNVIMDDDSGTRRTLLQDLFGGSAVLSDAFRGVASPSASATHSAAKAVALRELELPAYEQPPLPKLFDGLLGRIVGKRPFEVPPIQDDRMDVDEVVPALDAVARLPESIAEGPEIRQDELDALTELFRQSFTSPTPAALPSAHTNGNGVHHKPSAGSSKANGVSHPTAVKLPQKKPSSSPAPASVDIEMAETDSPPAVGKKRKKSRV
ncbi:WD40 repeat-like protein [Auriculariales sp. MPI-PUGE-AT-0066]|nr:WD40 repeat-like protein [Auriculariales sp. MPI-PUGE-AT-0066]